MPPRKPPAGTSGTFRGGVSFQRSLVISFFAHKLQRWSRAAGAAALPISGSVFYAGNFASNSSGISKLE